MKAAAMETEKRVNLLHEPLQVINIGLVKFAEDLKWMFDADPVLIDVGPASEAIPVLADRMILHAGPSRYGKYSYPVSAISPGNE